MSAIYPEGVSKATGFRLLQRTHPLSLLRYSMVVPTTMSQLRVALRDHPKLRQLWPPDASGAFSRGHKIPSNNEDVLDRVFFFAPVSHAKANVSLQTLYDGQRHKRDLLLDDPDFAQRLATFLRDKVGMTIQDLGGVEVDF